MEGTLQALIPNDSYLMWISAFFYFAASIYLIKKIREEGIPILYPISVYLLSIAVFFTLMGFSIINFAGQNAVISKEILAVLASFSIMFGASTIATFPLRLEWPSKEKTVYTALLIASVFLLSASYLLSNGRLDIIGRVAHAYAFITAGIFVIGYIVYTGIKSANVRMQSFSTSASLGLCCIFAHGLEAFQFLPFIAFSFFGLVSLKLPMILAILSPFAFIYVLITDRVIKPKFK